MAGVRLAAACIFLQFADALVAVINVALNIRDVISTILKNVLLELEPVPVHFGAKLQNRVAFVR